jgi:hypothetical protein
MYVLLKVLSVEINPNWNEAGHFPPHVLFGLDFWQLNFYQKFPNCFGQVLSQFGAQKDKMLHNK